MKMTCAKCGKRFDAEGCMYICPKCNHYHSQVGVRGKEWRQEKTEDKPFFSVTRPEVGTFEAGSEEPASAADNQGGGFFESADDGFLAENLKKLAANPDKYGSGPEAAKKVIAVCIGAILLALALGSVVSGLFSTGSWEDEYYDDYDDYYFGEEIYEISPGDTMDYGDFVTHVTDYGETDIEGAYDPVYGCKYVTVSFDTYSPYDISNEWDYDNTYTDVVLKADGEYFYSLYPEDLAIEDRDIRDLEESGMCAEVQYNGSWYCVFEVPEDATEFELIVTSWTSDEISYIMDLSL